MKRGVLIIMALFIFDICTAPVHDLRLRMLRLRSATEYAEKRFHELEFDRFINDLGYRESHNNWLCINSIGCFGEWQFSEKTLHHLGHRQITLKKFLDNPDIFPRKMQAEVLRGLIKVNLSYLKRYEDFVGDTILDVVVTKPGMIAASHLGGAGSLIKFLKSGGEINRSDVLGTSVSDYLKYFSNYNIE